MQKAAAYTTKNWIYFLLIVLAFVLYGNTIQNDYGLDDGYVVTANKYVQKGVDGIQEIFDNPYAVVDGIKLDSRPIALITYALEYEFFGENPHISHFFNVLFFAITLILIYLVLTKVYLLDKEHFLLPLIITLLYAVHPIHTEVFASLKNRDEILSLLFGLSFLYAADTYFSKPSGKWQYALLALLFFALCLMSKIVGFVFLGVFIITAIFKRNLQVKKWNYLFLFICVLFILRAVSVSFKDANRQTTFFENPLSENKDLLIHLGTCFNILFYHIKVMFFPAPLRFYYGYNVFELTSLFTPLAFISFLLHIALLVYGAVKYFKKQTIGLLIVLYFAILFWYSNLVIPYTGMFSERAMLLSSLWFIAFVVMGIYNILKSQKKLNAKQSNVIVLLISGVFFTAFVYMTIQRNFLWKNNITLMEHDIVNLDNSVMGNFIYANNLKAESKKSEIAEDKRAYGEKALYYYRQARNLAPAYPEFYFKMGSTFRYNLNNADSAKRYFGYAISLDSLYADANFELGKLYFEQQVFDRSYKYLKRAYERQPNDSMTLFYFAQSASNVNELSVCYKVNQEFLKLYPNLPYPYLNLGVYYSKILKDDSAVIYLDKAVALGARDPKLLQQLSVYYGNKKDNQKRDYYQQLLSDTAK